MTWRYFQYNNLASVSFDVQIIILEAVKGKHILFIININIDDDDDDDDDDDNYYYNYYTAV